MMNCSSSKIPILYILQNLLGFGGTERHLYEVTKRLNRDKFEPLVCSFNLNENMINEFKKINVDVMKLPVKRIYDYQAIKTGVKFIQLLKRKRIKIVQSFHSLPDLFVPIFSKIAGVPVIISSRRDLGFDKKRSIVFASTSFDMIEAEMMPSNIPRFRSQNIWYNSIFKNPT